MINTVTIEKLVPGGQGLATLENGKKVFVWNALPGEVVEIELTTDKKSFSEAVAVKIIKPSKDRIEPLDKTAYLSTSPWQIVSAEAEILHKQTILKEIFENKVKFSKLEPFCSAGLRYGYRNKMEYSFWWDIMQKRVRLAHFGRGTHSRIPVDGSVLAMPAINNAGKMLIEFIAKHEIPSRELKSVVIRTQQDGAVHIALYVINVLLVDLPWGDLGVAGLKIFAAKRNSPASVALRLLKQWGSTSMSDKLLGAKYEYGVDGFFQINLPVYEKALEVIKEFIPKRSSVVDLYAGVGSIGLSVTKGLLVCVESDIVSADFARINSSSRNNARVLATNIESALNEITANVTLIVDPPRAGLNDKVVRRIIAEKPKRVVYLSCNPATQVRDLAMLTESGYRVIYIQGFNFFPATPHIESLVVLDHD